MKDVFYHLLPSQVVDLTVLAWLFLKGLHEYLKVLVFFLPLFFFSIQQIQRKIQSLRFFKRCVGWNLN